MSKEVKKPLINWDEIAKLARPFPPGPPGPPPGPPIPRENEDGQNAGKGSAKNAAHNEANSGARGNSKGLPSATQNSPFRGMPRTGIGGWDSAAEGYNRMVQMEKKFTLEQLSCFETYKSDTVLDVCCGPGRLSVPISKKVKQVTALDASPKMLDYLKAYAKREKRTNIKTILQDWDDKAKAKKLPKHDIVLSSRNQSMGEIELLSSLSKRLVVIFIWANGGASIPETNMKLFEGTFKKPEGRPPFPRFNRDRRLGDNFLYNKIYDAGYNPNVRILSGGWEKIFKNKEEAYKELLTAKPQFIEEIDMKVFKKNANRFLTKEKDGKIKYFAPSKTMVIWWDVNDRD